ncbi:MAG: HNH endonuclease [Butyrivibrio sp.]|nr:HNH endonuclease [Butyrivibrio sp.]
MIKIKVKQAEEIEKWYADQVIPVILRKSKASIVFRNKLSYKYLHEAVKRDVLEDIVTKKADELEAKYDWIKEYLEIVRFVNGYEPFMAMRKKEYDARKLSDNARTPKYRKDMENYLDLYIGNALIKKYLGDTSKIKSIKQNKDTRKAFVDKEIGGILGGINEDISLIFNYDYFNEISDDFRATLVNKLDIKTCPYCNQQYIFYLGDGRYLGDLDHIRPKSKYSLFSMSLYNLIPACKPCNQLFKNDSALDFFNPYERGFGDDAVLHLRYSNVRQMIGLEEVNDMNWCINPRSTEEERTNLRNEIRLFRLNQVYKGHKGEIQLTLQRRFNLYNNYLKFVYGIIPYSELLDPTLLFGVSFDPKKYQDELMSKAISDVVKKN